MRLGGVVLGLVPMPVDTASPCEGLVSCLMDLSPFDALRLRDNHISHDTPFAYSSTYYGQLGINLSFLNLAECIRGNAPTGLSTELPRYHFATLVRIVPVYSILWWQPTYLPLGHPAQNIIIFPGTSKFFRTQISKVINMSTYTKAHPKGSIHVDWAESFWKQGKSSGNLSTWG